MSIQTISTIERETKAEVIWSGYGSFFIRNLPSGYFQDAAPAFVEANFGPCSLENNDSQIVKWVVLLRRLEAWRIDAVLAMSCDFSLACFLQSFIAQGPR